MPTAVGRPRKLDKDRLVKVTIYLSLSVVKQVKKQADLRGQTVAAQIRAWVYDAANE